MLQEICIKTSETILSVLNQESEIKDNAICHPQKYYSSIHRLLSGILGIVSNQNLHGNSGRTSVEAFQELESTLSSECVFVQNFKKTSPIEQEALSAFLQWFKLQTSGTVNLSNLYELMLSLEFPIKNGAITEDFDGQIPDTIGSFYTPINLADKCAELTLDNYIFQNIGIDGFSSNEEKENQQAKVYDLLTKSTYADHSCGTASFLLAILRYVDKHCSSDTKALKEKIVLNFEAIEADTLALEVGKIQVLRSIDRLDLYSELSKKFVHGNPILRPIDSIQASVFSNEFYYHNGLAMDPSRLKKADVIIGNPPWGEVGFDLAFFCHIILPKVNEVETQQELELLLGDLETSHPYLFDWLLEHEEANDLAVDEIYEDERFQNSTNGGLHTNVLFTELLNSLTTEKGSLGLILKGSTLSDKQNQGLVDKLKSDNRIVSRYEFSNVNRIFNIDQEEDFSILILGNSSKIKTNRSRKLTSLNQLNN